MKKRYLVVGLFLVCIIFGFYYFPMQKSGDAEEKVSSAVTDSAEADPVTSSIDGFKRPSDIDDYVWGNILKYASKGKSTNGKVEFYGKVVDQSGEPVAGAVVDASVVSFKLNFADYQAVASSDANVAPARSHYRRARKLFHYRRVWNIT